MRLKIFILAFLCLFTCKLFANGGGECQEEFSPSQGEELGLSSQELNSAKEAGSVLPFKDTPPTLAHKGEEPVLQSTEGEKAENLTLEGLSKSITEGAFLGDDHDLDFQLYLHRSFGSRDEQYGLKDVLDVEKPYPEVRNKLSVREQEITVFFKQKLAPESVKPFLISFRSQANRARRILKILANWGVWAKMLGFPNNFSNKLEREKSFFKYLNSGPLGQSIQDFILEQGLDFRVSSPKTVKEYLESSDYSYKDKTLVLYKVLDLMRQDFIKEGREDINQNLSIAMAELIHTVGFGNLHWRDKLKNQNPEVVLEGIKSMVSERNTIALNLGFDTGYYELQSHLLDHLSSDKVKSIQKEITSLDGRLANILKDFSEQPEEIVSTETFRMRILTSQESPFRGCVGRDCSTEVSFIKALDPVYLYFTLTDKEFISHGQITVVLGVTRNNKGESIKTAFVDKIQNIPNHRVLAMLEAIRLSLDEQGYKLALAQDESFVFGDLSNYHHTLEFVKNKILAHLKNKLYNFQVLKTNISFASDENTRANSSLDLLEFNLPQGSKDFKIRPLQIHSPKQLKGRLPKDWFLKAIQSTDLKDQIMITSHLVYLVKLNLIDKNYAVNYVKSKLENKELDFKLRKLALLTLMRLSMKDSEKSKQNAWFNFNLLESLLLNFSESEQARIRGEMSNWRNTSVFYKKEFIKNLSLILFYPTSLQEVFQSKLSVILDKNVVNTLHNTPLITRIQRRDLKNIQFLLNQRADPNAIDRDVFYPPLLWAIVVGDIRIVRSLLEKGANPYIQDPAGENARDHAKARGNRAIIRLLNNHRY